MSVRNFLWVRCVKNSKRIATLFFHDKIAKSFRNSSISNSRFRSWIGWIQAIRSRKRRFDTLEKISLAYNLPIENEMEEWRYCRFRLFWYANHNISWVDKWRSDKKFKGCCVTRKSQPSPHSLRRGLEKIHIVIIPVKEPEGHCEASSGDDLTLSRNISIWFVGLK